MMTEVQNEKIIHYLLQKNLPIDILSEVHDHMISQINDVMFNGLNFEEAFEEVKKSWAKDLDVKSSSIYDKVTPPLVKKIYWAKIKPIVMQSVGLGFIVALFWGLVLYAIPQLINLYLIWGLGLIFLINFIWAIYRYFKKNKPYYKYIKRHEKNKLSIYVDSNGMNFILVNTIFQILLSVFNYSDIETKSLLFLFILLSFFLVISLMRFQYLIEKKMIDNIENKSKPYFKYLYANPYE